MRNYYAIIIVPPSRFDWIYILLALDFDLEEAKSPGATKR